MWKFKNRKQQPSESSTEPTTTTTTTIVERRRISDSNSEGSNNTNTEHTEHSETTTTTAQTIDELLAKELNALSFQARETINEEIHGINVNQIYFEKIKEIEETPELLKESFRKLQLELHKLQPTSFAYHRCQQLYGSNNKNNNETENENDNDNDNDNVDDNNKDDENDDAIRRRNTVCYINTDEFRIMFLRCQLFDAPKAARRLINYVDLMYELYGDIGLQRRFRQEDLSEVELRVLQGGSFTILPGRDRAGRRIHFHITYNYTSVDFTLRQRLRIAFYVQLQLADDIETQRKGSVQITWYQNVNMFEDFATRTQVYQRLATCLPTRPGAVHICITGELEGNYTVVSNDSDGEDISSSSSRSSTTTATKMNPARSGTPVNIIKSMIGLSLGTKYRSKIRIHTGSAMECVYALQSFGIPSNQIPLVVGTTVKKKRRRKETNTKKDDGASSGTNNHNHSNSTHPLKLTNHTKWLNLCQWKENNMKVSGEKWKYQDGNHDRSSVDGRRLHQEIIECPQHSDILNGRGKEVMKHPGNNVLRSLVHSKLDDYINLNSYNEKVKLTMGLVHLLQNTYGARFLKEETTIGTNNGGVQFSCWVEVTNEDARLKVRVAFRDRIRKLQQQQEQQQQQQSQIMMQSPVMMKTPTSPTCTDEQSIDKSNKNDDGAADDAIAINNTNTKKQEKKIDTPDRQPKHKQVTSLKLPLPIPATSLYNVQQQQQQQHQQHQGDEDTDNTTSLFLSMTSGGSKFGSDSSSSSICSSSGKKRPLVRTKEYTSCFDCVNNF